MEWLKAGVIATLFGSLVLTVIYFFLYSQERKKFLLIWTISWFFYTLRFAFILLNLFYGDHPLTTILVHSVTLISGILLIYGVYELMQRGFPPAWLIICSAGILWIIVAVLSEASALWISFPLFTFMAWIYIWTGRTIIISPLGNGKSKYLTGGALIVWGVHKADFPFLRNVEWFAPFGFMLGALLELITAIGMLIMFFEMNSKELKDSEKRYKALFDYAGVGITYISTDGEIISVNKTVANWHKMTPEEMIGTTFSEGPEDFQYNIIMNGVKAAIAENKTITAEVEMIHEHGTRWLLNHYTAIKENGEVTGFQIISDDITTRKHAENAFYESQRRLIESQDIAKVGWWEFNSAIEIFKLSEETYKQLGLAWDQKEITLQVILDIIPKDWRQKFLDQVEAIQKTGKSEFELPIITLSGENRWLWIKGELQDQAETSKKIFGMTQDITEKKYNSDQLERSYTEIKTLHEIDQIIVSSIEHHNTTKKLLKAVLEGVKLDAAILYKFHPETYTLEYSESHGLNTTELYNSKGKLGHGILGNVAKDRALLHFCDMERESNNFNRIKAFIAEDFRTYYGVPLIAKGELKGVLEIFNRDPLDCEDFRIHLIETISRQVAIAIDNMQLYSRLSKANLDLQLAYETTLEGWAKTLELRDQETEGHSERVTDLTIQLARIYGIDDQEIVHIRRGAMLHDIGKMGIPDSILHKPGPLNDEEWVIMKKHPQLAYDYLKGIPFLKKALDIPFFHHEKWDGSGYPIGLKGDQIPLAPRLFAVVDVYEALSSHRPYREAWPQKKIIEYMKSESGKHFDSRVLDSFLEVVLN